MSSSGVVVAATQSTNISSGTMGELGEQVILSYIIAKYKESTGKNASVEKIPKTIKIGFTITYDYEYKITFGSTSKTYSSKDVQVIDGQVIISSKKLIDDFKLTPEQATHQPEKDVFSSIDDTALAWTLTYYARSNDKNNMLEYASAIYENGTGFSFSKPNIAKTDTPWKVVIPNAPSGYNMVAAIHSHPKISGRDYENFSTYDDETALITGDLEWARNHYANITKESIPLYVATPSGKIKKLTITSTKNYNRPDYKVVKVFTGIKY
jgi:hypothetical protein